MRFEMPCTCPSPAGVEEDVMRTARLLVLLPCGVSGRPTKRG